MGEPKTPHFFDFGMSGRVPKPNKQLFLSLETPGYLKEIKKQSQIILQSYYCYTFHFFWQFSKRRAPANPADPSKEILKILEAGSISSEKHEIGIL